MKEETCPIVPTENNTTQKLMVSLLKKHNISKLPKKRFVVPYANNAMSSIKGINTWKFKSLADPNFHSTFLWSISFSIADTSFIQNWTLPNIKEALFNSLSFPLTRRGEAHYLQYHSMVLIKGPKIGHPSVYQAAILHGLFKMLPDLCQILQKYTAFVGSDTHPTTFSESLSNIGFTIIVVKFSGKNNFMTLLLWWIQFSDHTWN